MHWHWTESDRSAWQTPGFWVFHAKANWNDESFLHLKWRQNSHLFRMPKVIWSIRRSEEAHGNPHQRKGIQLYPMSEIVWSSCSSQKTHAHSQWSKDPHLFRMSFGQAANLRTHMLIHYRKKTHNCRMWEVIWTRHHLEKTHDHPYCWERTRMLRMRRFIWYGWNPEEAQAHPQWGEAAQVHTVQLYLFTGKHS